MRDEGRSYSSLSPDEQEAVSVWVNGFEQRFGHTGPAAIEQTINEAPAALRGALLVELLPLAIDAYRQQHRVTPTLHELRLAHPNLASELTGVYPSLSASYRLPVELHGYRVIRVVGDGGQAVVLRAQDDVHSTVAIKLSTSPEHNDLLLRERRILGECDHPGIVPVIGSGMQEGAAYYVMPYLKGKTLADLYATHRPDGEEAIRIGVELCGIVEHLHGLGILHRDIKPANVWIDDYGGLKLIDLGMAIERRRWGQPVSQLREFHGTPAFMSPEQAATDGERDGELSDVFSLGATLYWLGTGSAPFEGRSGESALREAAAGQFDRDRLSIASGWPRPLVNACLRAMAAEPPQRYRSASALRGSLEASRSASTVSRRSRLAFLLLVLVLAALTVLYSRYELQSHAGRRSDVTGQEEEKEPGSLAAGADADAFETAPGVKARAEPDRAVGNSDGIEPPEIAAPSFVPKLVHPIFVYPEPRIANYSVEQYIESTVPQLPASPELDYLAPVEQRCSEARHWLASIPAGTRMGHLAGIRFHPTSLVPIAPAIDSIKVVYKARDVEGGRLVDRTITIKNPSNVNGPTIWVYEGLTRPLTKDDRTEYAIDTSEPAVPTSRSLATRVPPGLASIAFYAVLRDGSRTPVYEARNDDYAFVKQVFPWSTPPKGFQLDAYLFLRRTATMDRKLGLVSYLKNLISKDTPFRGRIERTRFGFFVVPPEGVIAIEVVHSSKPNEPMTQVKPGTVDVTYRFPSLVIGPISFSVPNEQFIELAEDALSYSKRYHAN